MLEAADRLDRKEAGITAPVLAVVELRTRGLTYQQIADELAIGVSTAHHRYARYEHAGEPIAFFRIWVRALCAIGLRIDEACHARRRDVDLVAAVWHWRRAARRTHHPLPQQRRRPPRPQHPPRRRRARVAPRPAPTGRSRPTTRPTWARRAPPTGRRRQGRVGDGQRRRPQRPRRRIDGQHQRRHARSGPVARPSGASHPRQRDGDPRSPAVAGDRCRAPRIWLAALWGSLRVNGGRPFSDVREHQGDSW